MPAQPAIQLQDIHKTFLKGEQTVTALNNITLTINQGECVALMGHNGAGKSTLLRLLSGLIIPDKGQTTLLGENKKSQHLGYMTPNERSFNWRLTGRQNLHYFGVLCGVPKAQRTQRIAHWAQTFDIDYLDQRFDRYSTGMRQHLALLRVMLHDPKLLLLDEPARSLDDASCQRLIQAITTLRDLSHTTIIIATHLMPLAQELCTRVVTMRNGAIENDRGKPTWDRPPKQHTLLTSQLSTTEQEILRALPEIYSLRNLEDHPASEITLNPTNGALQTILTRCHTLGIQIWECNQQDNA